MRTIQYKPSSLLWLGIMCVFFAWGGYAVYVDEDGGSAVFAGLVMSLFAVGSIMSFMAMFGDRIAVSYDDTHVTVGSLWRKYTMPWADVRDITVDGITFYALGFIPVSKTNYLNFAVAGGLLGTKKLRVTIKLLDFDKDEIPQLILDMARTKAGATRAMTSAASAASKYSANSDADAVIQRYMAQKKSTAAGAAAAGAGRSPPPSSSRGPAQFGRRSGR